MARKDWWLPVPSLNCRYEVDPRGVLRNAKTKKRLRAYVRGTRKTYSVYVDGKKTSATVKSLLWEVHGKMPICQKRGHKPKKV